MARGIGPTLAEIRAWPAAVSIEQAAAALGVSRAHAYESVRLGTFPARSLKVGRRTVILTASILAVLDPDGVRCRDTAPHQCRSEARETGALDSSSSSGGRAA